MKEKPTKRLEFSELQKAQIFTRDRGLCAFSGKSLWVLDYGISPTMEIDRAEHIKPASKGGTATLDNGVCASFLFNRKKRDNSADNIYFFKNGFPTEEFYYFFGKVSEETANNIKKFEQLDYSDWFFNRALFRFRLGVQWIYDNNNSNKKYIRDDKYYAKSTIVYFNKRKKEKAKSGVSSLKERGLVSDNLSLDQQVMYNLQDKTDVEEVIAIMHKLYPYFREGNKTLDKFAEISEKEEAKTFKDEISANNLLTKLDKGNLLHNLEILWNV